MEDTLTKKDEVHDLFAEVADSNGYGSFLTHFAKAFCVADANLFSLLLPTALYLIDRYNLTSKVEKR